MICSYHPDPTISFRRGGSRGLIATESTGNSSAAASAEYAGRKETPTDTDRIRMRAVSASRKRYIGFCDVLPFIISNFAPRVMRFDSMGRRAQSHQNSETTRIAHARRGSRITPPSVSCSATSARASRSMLRVSDVLVVSTANHRFLEPLQYSKHTQSAILWGRQSAGNISASFGKFKGTIKITEQAHSRSDKQRLR